MLTLSSLKSRFKSSTVVALLLTLSAAFWAYEKYRDPWPFQADLVRYRYPVMEIKDLKEEWEVAIPYYVRQLQLGNHSTSAVNSLANAYLAKAKSTGSDEDYDLAEKYALKSLELPLKPNIGAELVLAQVEQARHLFGDSMARIDRIEKLASSDERIATTFTRLTALLATGRATEALALAGFLTAKASSSTHLVYYGLAQELAGDRTGAHATYLRALRKDDATQPKIAAWTRGVLGRFYLSSGMVRAARETLQESLRIQPDQLLSLEVLGSLERQEGNYTEAEKALTAAFSKRPDAGFLLELGLVARDRGDQQKAQAYFAQAEKALRMDLSQGRYGHRLKLVKALLIQTPPNQNVSDRAIGNAQTAMRLCEQELGVRNTSEVHEYFAHAAYVAGEYPLAKAQIELATRSANPSARAFYLASVIEEKVGDRSQAKDYKEKARQINRRAEYLYKDQFRIAAPARPNTNLGRS